MKVKTNELEGELLNQAVAYCVEQSKKFPVFFDGEPMSKGDYITDWALAGPIIEREGIGLKRNAPCSDGRQWEASPSITAKGAGGEWGYGPTPLTAAMRCYVASKLGDEIEIPKEVCDEH